MDGDDTRADPSSAKVIMTVQQPYGNHNGGDIWFGGNDCMVGLPPFIFFFLFFSYSYFSARSVTPDHTGVFILLFDLYWMVGEQ